MSGIIYNFSGAGISAVIGNYEDSDIYSMNEKPLYINNSNTAYWVGRGFGSSYNESLERYLYQWKLYRRTSGTGYDLDSIGFDILYAQSIETISDVDIDAYPWYSINPGDNPAPTVTLGEGSIMPPLNSNMVLASFL